MKKKLICLVLAAACIAAFAACGKKGVDTNNVKGYDDLIALNPKIGVQIGTTGDIFASDSVEDGGFGEENVEKYSKGMDAVQALAQGKIDAVVIDDEPAKAFISDAEGLRILDEVYVEEAYAMCFAKGSELTQQFNQAIAELKADGTFDAIIEYYIEGKGERYESPANADRSNGALVMATNAEFPPYEYKENDEILGIDADLAQAIADRLGMSLTIEDMSFDSIIMAVQGGKADFGAAGMTVTEERKEEVDFSDSYYTGRQVIIVRK